MATKKIYFTFIFAVISVMAHAGLSPFEIGWDDKEIRLGPGQKYSTDIVIRVPEGYFLYKDRTDLSFTALEGVMVDSILYPEAASKDDPFTGKKIQVYKEGELVIKVTFAVPAAMGEGERRPAAILEMQGCAEKICIRPERHLLSWSLLITPHAQVVKEAPSSFFRKGLFDIRQLLSTKDFGGIVTKGRLFAIFAAFIAGLLTSLTPCVWPLIPVTLLIIGVHKKGHLLGNFLLSVAFAGGIAVTYGLLGTIASAAGARLSFLFESPVFILAVGLFFIAMALSMFGVFSLSLPLRLQNRLARLGGAGYRGAFLSGVSVGLLATPCAGPLLVPMLVWVAEKQHYAFGAVILAVYAFGLGAVYIAVGTFYGAFASRLKSVRAGLAVKKLLGALILITAFYYLSSLLPLSAPDNEMNWKASEQDAIVESLSTGRPMMIVVGAKWCPPCAKLKDNVLSDAKVRQAAETVVLFYIDATVDTEETNRLLDKYRILGWPTILFVGKNGKVYDDLTYAGAVPTAEELIKTIKAAQAR